MILGRTLSNIAEMIKIEWITKSWGLSEQPNALFLTMKCPFSLKLKKNLKSPKHCRVSKTFLGMVGYLKTQLLKEKNPEVCIDKKDLYKILNIINMIVVVI